MTTRKRTHNGRLAHFGRRANSAGYWSEKWRKTNEKEEFYWASQGKLGTYAYGFAHYLPRPGLIVEAGCGTGRYVRALQVHGYDAIGMEWDKEILQRTKAIWPAAPLITGDVRKFPLPDESVHAVMSLGVIEHFDDPWSVLVDAHRILKPQGILYLVVPYANHLRMFLARLGFFPSVIDNRDFYQYLLSDQEIRTELDRLGFEVRASFANASVAGFMSEFPTFKQLLKSRLVGRVANGLNRVRMFGSLTGHVVHYVAQKR